eukprot:g13962.t1
MEPQKNETAATTTAPTTSDNNTWKEKKIPHYARATYEEGKIPDNQEQVLQRPKNTPPWSSPMLTGLTWKSTTLYEEICRLDLQSHVADLHVKGYTVIPPEKVMPASYCKKLTEALLNVCERRTGVRPDVENGTTHEGMQHSLGQFMRFLTFEDPTFEPMITNPVMMALVSYILGPDAILSLNDGMIKGPGKNFTPLHNDNGSPGPFPDFGYGLTMNLILSDYDEDSGGLGFVPGSHLLKREPTQAEYDMMQKDGATVPVVAKAGSLIVWGANCWHVSYPRKKPGLRLTLLYFFVESRMQTQCPFRRVCSEQFPETMERNPPRFSGLMDVYGAMPMDEEADFDQGKFVKRARVNKHNIHKSLPMWKEFYGITEETFSGRNRKEIKKHNSLL